MVVFMKLFTVPQYSYESLMMLCHQFNAWNSLLHFFHCQQPARLFTELKSGK